MKSDRAKGTKAEANGSASRLPAADAEKAKKLAEEVDKILVVPKPVIYRLKFRIRGITPLVICRFDEKAKQQIAESGTAGADNNKKKSKSPKDPMKEFNAGRHVSREGWDGFHAGGLRAAMIGAARMTKLTMVTMKMGIFVVADGFDSNRIPLVRIDGKAEPFTAMCRTSTGQPYPRTRPLYEPWEATVHLTINGLLLNPDQAANLLQLAGLWGGIGEHRPTAPESLTGDNGRFEIPGLEGGG
jgi:hypothetical protein